MKIYATYEPLKPTEEVPGCPIEYVFLRDHRQAIEQERMQERYRCIQELERCAVYGSGEVRAGVQRCITVILEMGPMK